MKKRILLITVTAGEGHNSINKAVLNKLAQNPENEIRSLDLFKEYSSKFKTWIINDGYLMACKYLPTIYNACYKQLLKAKPEKKDSSVSQLSIKKEMPKLLKTIYEFKPDVIVTPHFFPAIALTNLRKVYPIPAKIITILTDFTVHPFWEAATGIEYLVTPTNLYDDILISKGFKKEQLLNFGLPVKEEFSIQYDKTLARQELELSPDLFTILVMKGGGGFGGMKKIVKELFNCKNPLQIVCVNGKDKKGKEKIKNFLKNKTTIHKVVNLGYVDYVNKLMSASDVLVGKCGGISTCEALNKELPMIIDKKIVQHELGNVIFITSNNAGFQIKKDFSLLSIIETISSFPSIIETMRKNISEIKKPNAIYDLVNFVENSENVKYENCDLILQLKNSNIIKAVKQAKNLEKKANKSEKDAKN